MNSKAKDVVIRRKVRAVKFGFYDDSDVRDRSVLEVTTPVSFDPNNAPLPNGLYDPRLGACPQTTPYCPTCALNAHDCPGHFGHIELVVPCYHPVLFPEIVQFLRLKCFQCHRLQANPHQLLVFLVKFQLLYRNRMSELAELDEVLAGAAAGARAGHEGSGGGAAVALARIGAEGMASVLERYRNELDDTSDSHQQRRRRQSATTASLTSRQREVRKALAADFVAACKAKTCPHCGSAAPAVRGDAGNKVFLRYTKAAQKVNALGRRTNSSSNNNNEGAVLESALKERGDSRGGYESDDTVPEPLEGDDVNMDSDDNEDGSSDDDDDDDNNSQSNVGPADENSDDEGGAGATAPSKNKDKYMHPGEVQAQLKRTWDLDPFLCSCLFGFGFDSEGSAEASRAVAYPRSSGLDKFFMRAVPVPPSRFRPSLLLGIMTAEHSQTQYLGKILQLNALIRTHLDGGADGSASSQATAAPAASSSKVYTTWMELQTTLNCYMDSSKDPSASPNTAPGIRQILERKEGLFRKNMMGKRVDFACRSVISPDPYIGANEIGLPRYFAEVLTYPTPVTDLNASHMRALVERGIDAYPGARWVEVHGKRVDLTKMTRFKREALAANLLSAGKKTGMPAIVGRQLADGDYVLMNRQPTLHKPGIMAHRVRVLHNPTQKTIRMHYANCNTYNADYDGDELNCHFPQSELARSEAIHIARTDYQYIVPTDGTPLRGLIQDHVVGGVKLTKRDTFLEKWEYQQLIFAALSSLQGLEVVPAGMDIEIVAPAVLKPRELWTGKQVVTTLLLHLCKTNHGDTGRGPAGITLERKAKSPEAAFGPLLEEHLVLIRDGELLRGVLDKAAFGATDFSLVHGVYEAYGPEKAGILLNALGRLFTAYIQYFAGHSCRMEDLVLTKRADQDRRVLVERSYNQGARAAKAWADSDGGKVPIPPVRDQPNSGKALKPDEAASAAAKIAELLTGTDAKHNHAALDAYMQSQLNPLSSEIVQKCLPSGLSVPFPYNSFSIMTVTGAKGSIVNQSQVSCALGQQALEGRRVPRMSSGRTLPSFAPFDPSPRADGFVMDRFLTGVRPQEYYFHCMAGREGLVDTAVKTSRSGYLQRCLVKHLEELTISYDFTVRNAEGGVVQFLYGEDGLDPTKASYLDGTEKSFDFMARNYGALNTRNSALPNSTIEDAAAIALTCEAVQNGSIAFPSIGGRVLARRLRVGSDWNPGALCTGWHKATVTKVRHNGKSVDIRYDNDGQIVARVPIHADLSERNAADQGATNLATIVKPACEDPVLSSIDTGRCVGVNGACVSEKIALAAHHAMATGKVRASMNSLGVTRQQLSRLVGAKYSASLCAPGEAVGCIAAQSVGEPSTQMTLNTFHLAGSGANVTLGIPRLREVIMTAAREPKTPTMSIPLHEHVSEAEALRLTRRLTKLNLMELVASDQGVCVKETLDCVGGNDWMRNYIITIKLHPAERIREAFGLSIHSVAAVIAKNFVPKLAAIMKTELRRSSAETEIIGGQSSDYVHDDSGSMELGEDVQVERGTRQQASDEENDDEAPTEEDGADGKRYRQRSDSATYDDDEDETGSDSDDEPVENVEGRNRSMSASTSVPAHDAFSTMTKTADDGVSPVVNTRQNTITLQPLSVDPASPPLLMVDLVEKAASTTLLRSIKGIQEAYVNEEDGRGRCLQTLGVNFEEIWKLQDVEHERLMSNDIWAIRCAYGVEAARISIVNQITSVFGAYGIAVDPRHLSLIADYMTFDGGYKSMNRTGMESSSSPFLQMSFETTVNFLKQSAVLGLSDDLSSPSGNVVMGRPVHNGTGAFDLLAGVSRH